MKFSCAENLKTGLDIIISSLAVYEKAAQNAAF